jgi:hypothetical protein
MSSINIDKDKAKEILSKAFNDKSTILDQEFNPLIKSIFKGNHKTFKYVLFTNLLAIATDERANGLSLQAGANLNGAFDSRSLCHNVVVEFERNHLKNALGGSNEPYLNKPARFPSLSTQNAVRAGRDRITLTALIQILSKINLSKVAYEYLRWSIKVLLDIVKQSKKLENVTEKRKPEVIDLLNYIEIFLEESIEGETSIVIVGAIEKLLSLNFDEQYIVKPHKVNQSGASSKEIGDIDIYNGDQYLYSIEVKDKKFFKHDVEHAVRKVRENGGNKLVFIFGYRGLHDRDEIWKYINHLGKEGFFLSMYGIDAYVNFMLMKCPDINKDNLIKLLMETAIEINAKTETKIRIRQVAEKFGLILEE